jgi:uncharacterized protein
MKTLFTLAATAFAVAAFAPAASAASFNCYGRLTVTEAAICANSQLSSLDSQMAKAYRISFRAYGNYVKGTQVPWLRARNACGANVACLRASYNERIGSLQILDGNGAP